MLPKHAARLSDAGHDVSPPPSAASPRLNHALDHLVQALEAIDDLSEMRVGLREGARAGLQALIVAEGEITDQMHQAAAVWDAVDAVMEAVEEMTTGAAGVAAGAPGGSRG